MSLSQSIRSSAKWLLAGNLGNSLLGFAFGIVLARLLVPEDFGLIVTVQIFTGVAGLVAGGGMGQALVRASEADAHDFNVVFTIQIGICAVIYLLFFVLAPYFAVWYREPIYESLLRVTALSFLLRPLVGTHNAWLSREMQFKARSIVQVSCGVITSVLSIVMAWHEMGVWSLTLSGIFGSIVSWALLSRLTPLRPKLTFDRATARRLTGVGIRFSLLDIISYLRRQSTNFVIGRMVNPAAVGLYNKADSLGKLPFSTISSAVYQPVFRALSIEQHNLDKSKYIFFRTVMLLLVYSAPAYITFSILAEPFIRVVYGSNWVESAAPMSILAWAWMFSCVNQPAGALLAAQGKLQQEIIVQATTLVLNVVACAVGLRWGLVGVAWGMILVRLYTVTHMLLLVNTCFRLKRQEFFDAVRPGLVLGASTAFILLSFTLMVPDAMKIKHEMVFLGAALAVSGSSFFLMMLFPPIKGLTDESTRWRKALRITRKTVA